MYIKDIWNNIWCSSRINSWATFIVIHAPFGQHNSEIWHEFSIFILMIYNYTFHLSSEILLYYKVVWLSVQYCKMVEYKFLKMNKGKTKILIVGPKHERERIEVGLGTLALQSKKEIKNLDLNILECDLSFIFILIKGQKLFVNWEILLGFNPF